MIRSQALHCVYQHHIAHHLKVSQSDHDGDTSVVTTSFGWVLKWCSSFLTSTFSFRIGFNCMSFTLIYIISISCILFQPRIILLHLKLPFKYHLRVSLQWLCNITGIVSVFSHLSRMESWSEKNAGKRGTVSYFLQLMEDVNKQSSPQGTYHQVYKVFLSI